MGLRGEDAASDVAVAAFADQLDAFFRAVQATDHWRRRVVRGNLRLLGMVAACHVPLAVYLRLRPVQGGRLPGAGRGRRRGRPRPRRPA